MTELRFAVVGDNCIDEFTAPVNKSLVGGNALNVAVQLSRLGHKTFYFGAIGQDRNGYSVKDALVTWGVDQTYVKLEKGKTARTVISIQHSGERKIDLEDFGVCATYFPSDVDCGVLLEMDHVHLGWIADGGRLRRMLSDAGVSVSQDISVNAKPNDIQVEGLSIAFSSAGASRDEALKLADKLLNDGAHIAVVTRGEFGSLAKSNLELVETGIDPVAVVDTTGAGDSFIAGFLSRFLVEGDLMGGITLGRTTSAAACLHIGGFPQ